MALPIQPRNEDAAYARAIARFEADREITQRSKEIVFRYCRDAALGKTVLRRAKKKIGLSRLRSNLTVLRDVLAFRSERIRIG